MQTLLQKRTYIDFNEALKDELNLLRENPNFNKEALNWETFDALSSRTCFFGQGFNQSATTYASQHREVAGKIKEFEFDLEMWTEPLTVLELWSAILQKRGDKEQIKRVFDYLKNGTPWNAKVKEPLIRNNDTFLQIGPI